MKKEYKIDGKSVEQYWTDKIIICGTKDQSPYV